MGAILTIRLRRRMLACACLAVSLGAAPAHAATTSGSGTATIVTPLSLVNTAPLSFGDVVPSATAGKVTVSITGVRTTTGGVTPAGGTVSAAGFTGKANFFPFWVTVSNPPASITLTRGVSGPTMTVTNFTVEGGTGARFVLFASIFTFRVGGTLNVAANQAPGTYNGTFPMTVNYF